MPFASILTLSRAIAGYLTLSRAISAISQDRGQSCDKVGPLLQIVLTPDHIQAFSGVGRCRAQGGPTIGAKRRHRGAKRRASLGGSGGMLPRKILKSRLKSVQSGAFPGHI